MTALGEITTTMRQSRALWTGVVALVALVLIAFGGVFAVGGLKAAPLPQVYEVIVRYVPAGMHAYGAVMLLLGLVLLHAIAPRGGNTGDVLAHYTLAATFGFAAGVAGTFAGSWALTGVQTWSAIIYWASIAGFAFMCWKFPPESRLDGLGRAA